ncbi:MAG TPA: class I SAM-dependent methyltransferase [Haliangiales bacterium]|nr:class I SAM-dependent methyltransferase [Haliangiales bacterium]
MTTSGGARLCCPDCGQALTEAASALACDGCARRFPIHEIARAPLLFARRSPFHAREVDILADKRKRLLDPEGAVRALRHWRTGNLVDLLRSVAGRKLLNFGAGDGADRAWLEGQGFQVTAIDAAPSPAADCICDAHHLPFGDGEFEVVTSLQVLEHLYDPFRAVAEVARVLAPGGDFVGSVAFLEQFHAQSYFHMTHLGLREVLERAGLTGIEIYPGWSFLEALGQNFWPWNLVRPVRALSRVVNRARFRAGMGLWHVTYALRLRRLPKEHALMYSASLIFRARRAGSRK